ncbi:MAG: alpha/beta fold hydrolase [Hyphomicrobiaceae bacterium]
MQSHENTTAKDDGDQAFQLFCTPALSSHRTKDHDELVERARYHLRSAETRRLTTSICEVKTYIFVPDAEPKANVMLVHGWTGEAAFMGAVAERLRRGGYRTVLMDMPAHGGSEGSEATLFECAQAILEVAEAMAPVRFALGHSIGALALLTVGEGHYPLPRSYPFEAYVLISMPDAFSDVTLEFGQELQLSPAAQRAFERRLEALAGRPISDFSGTALLNAVECPALLMHSRDDAEVPFGCSVRMVAACAAATMKAFDGLGHRAILYTPPVIRTALNFIDAQMKHG